MEFGKAWRRWFHRRPKLESDVVSGHRPRFQSLLEVQAYVDRQLTDGLPANWSYRQGQHSLEWRIEPRVRTDKVAGSVDFILEVSGDYQLFILYYGNSDAGFCFRYLSTAVVLPSKYLPEFSLAQALTHLIEHCEPNMWGLT